MEKERFFENVYQVVAQIPEGRVTTYGAIAEFLGSKRGARMVGWALNGAFSKNIPAHRVLNKEGLLTGKFYFGINTMQELLEKEGLTIVDNKISDLNKYFWDPKEELGF